ncbi:hypothetical protein [Brevibacterium sp. SMBL_HHYL_HB1]|uniref:hypothetical protein n=1 Tax=Brevibacterium sp. SMBL_HHYL_HB1 TaxID=2777556 RepID=UPI001BAD12D0|nr:hypothetical protein [Brevibacterium sp. SMBL_HHYL_HB1]QUL79889.1 hypothetical protein IG171_03310 [Brevibacterium sp. SMBL_HHYL_HB1]
MNKIETAKQEGYSKRTLKSLDTALEWRLGTAEGIVSGAIPGAYSPDFTQQVNDAITETDNPNASALSPSERERFLTGPSAIEDAMSDAFAKIDTGDTLARLRRARDDLNAAIEAIQTAETIAQLEKRQRQADAAPLKDIMGLAALEVETTADDDPDQGSQDPSDY